MEITFIAMDTLTHSWYETHIEHITRLRKHALQKDPHLPQYDKSHLNNPAYNSNSNTNSIEGNIGIYGTTLLTSKHQNLNS